MSWPPLRLAVGLLLVAGLCVADVSRPGGAGHALQFRDHGSALIAPFNDLGRDAFTFEAWVQTTDDCHRSALFSYAKDSKSTDEDQRVADFNHLVIFDPTQLVACHDFKYLDLWPDSDKKSCYTAFNHSYNLPNFVERDGRWHHVAVTWTAADNGLVKIYQDGLLRIQAATGKTAPLEPGGALMLGAEQDCFGGCTDRGQGFFGLMDEVRIWRVARSQKDILAHMRSTRGLENHQDLAAYWQFNDPADTGVLRQTASARDASGRGNHLTLVNLPSASKQRIAKGDRTLEAGALSFRNNFAMNQSLAGMPTRDFTVEFWARTPHFNHSSSHQDKFAEFFSFASVVPHVGRYGQSVLLRDAVLIEKYDTEFRGTRYLHRQDFSTRGSISVHVNSDREGLGRQHEHWVDFKTDWTDNDWHHLAVSWAYESGAVKLYIDGQEKPAFWVSRGGSIEVKNPADGGVSSHIAQRTERTANGSLVLGQRQLCFGGCFTPEYSLHGELAQLRVWSRVLGRDELAGNMFAAQPASTEGLALSYNFDPANLDKSGPGQGFIRDASPSGQRNDLELGADAPAFVYSTAPLAEPDGRPVEQPRPGAAGTAMRLSDQQVLLLKNFQGFPEEELTLEFWMSSTDACRKGTPFSYATGGYGKNDNSFLLFDYNDWGVSVMEDEGHLGDHTSGVGSTDGQWHHIAVTWRSADGETKLYDNGREVWSVTRGKGKRIPSGGTLVVGREQDCEGGCFDSDEGAAGDIQDDWDQEYGAQDFFGLIDEMRLWRRVRSGDQIREGMRGSLYRRGITGDSFNASGSTIDPHHPDLVAYWNFDEGAGYTVKDITGHGHDLLAAEPPQWEVVQWLSVCGNGRLEGLEECDVGSTQGGSGCSASCKVEEGWECSRTSPSRCWRSGSGHSRGGADPGGNPHGPSGDPSLRPDEGGGGGSGGGGGGGGRSRPGKSGMPAGAIVAIVLSSVAVAAGGVAAVVFRQTIYERVPQVEAAVNSIQRRFQGRRQPYDYAAELGLGPDDLDVTPDFVALRPPPSRGGYQELPSAGPPAGPGSVSLVD